MADGSWRKLLSNSRTLARGDGWSVADVVCTAGPDDRPFEERHAYDTIALVTGGTFQYRSAAGHALMTPGSLMLCNHGRSYECGHEHGRGDRCVAFWYERDFFARIGGRPFKASHLPPLKPLSRLVARVAAMTSDTPWDEIAFDIASMAIKIEGSASGDRDRTPPNATARVTRVVRAIDKHFDATLTLEKLARHAGLSPYHFLRTFRRVTGLTPHQYLLRKRLREAAIRLRRSGKIIDVALDCGFGDVSNFNRAFRREFGVTPRAYRR